MAAVEPAPSAAPVRGWRLARVAGVPVHLRGSALVTLGVLWGVLHARLAEGAWPAWWHAPLLAGLACGALLLSILGHELAHALVARGLGLTVAAVTVLPLGGVTRLAEEPADPRDEALVAGAGPLATLLAAGVLLATGRGLGPLGLPAQLLVLAGHLNLLVGVFNLLPGHPLDGGALVRSAVWAATGDPARALRRSGTLGQALGAALVVAGALGATPGGPVAAEPGWLWLAGVGAVLAVTARLGVAQAGIRVRLAGLRVGDLARAVGAELPGQATVAAAVPVTAGGGSALVLDAGGTPVGVLGPAEVATVPPAARVRVTVAQAMRPVRGTVAADADLLAVVSRFRRTRDSTVAVVGDGGAVGVLAASDVLDHLDGPGTARR